MFRNLVCSNNVRVDSNGHVMVKVNERFEIAPMSYMLPPTSSIYFGGRMVRDHEVGINNETKEVSYFRNYEGFLQSLSKMGFLYSYPNLGVTALDYDRIFNGKIELQEVDFNLDEFNHLTSSLSKRVPAYKFAAYLTFERGLTTAISQNGEQTVRSERYSSLRLECLHKDGKTLRFLNFESDRSAADHLAGVSNELDAVVERLGAFEDGYCLTPKCYPCVLSSQVAGYYLHEAIGHSMEADTRSSRKIIELGQRNVAAEFVTVCEEPLYEYDDEFTPVQRVSLIEKGMYGELLHSIDSAASMRVAPNGHAWSLMGWQVPIPRMKYIRMLNGSPTLEHLLALFKECIYLDIAEGAHTSQGTFVIQVGEASLVRNGRVYKRLGKVVVSGDCISSVGAIVGVGNDGTKTIISCGKADQGGFKTTSEAPCIAISSLKVVKS